jgi:hypothetical protein
MRDNNLGVCVYIKQPEYLSRYSDGLLVTRLGLDSRQRQTFFSTPQRPDRLRGPASLLSNESRRIFPRDYSDWGVKLTTRLHLVPR